MKKLLALFVLVLISIGPTQADGLFIKQGPTIVFKAACISPHVERIAGALQDLPDGNYTMAEMLLAMAGRADIIFPPLTAEETLLCGGELIPLPTWKVARRGVEIDRPVSSVDMGGVRTSTKDRILIGEPCGSLYRLSTTACKGCEWRSVGPRDLNENIPVAVCELR